MHAFSKRILDIEILKTLKGFEYFFAPGSFVEEKSERVEKERDRARER